MEKFIAHAPIEQNVNIFIINEEGTAGSVCVGLGYLKYSNPLMVQKRVEEFEQNELQELAPGFHLMDKEEAFNYALSQASGSPFEDRFATPGGDNWDSLDLSPSVNWQPPEAIPPVSKYEIEQFWLAVESTTSEGKKTIIFDALYINKPLEYENSDEEEPLDSDYHVDLDGNPIEAIGWHRSLEHEEFSNYYEPITFNESYVLLGWGKYIKPKFTK